MCNGVMGNQTLVRPYDGMLLSSKMEQITRAWGNIDDSQLHYAMWKKPNKKYSAWFHLYDILEKAEM